MLRFLLVDDETSLADILSRWLEQTYGEVEVRSAPSNPEALRILESFTPRLVITDFHHYGGTGADLLKHLRLDPKTRHIPVVLLSASVQLEREHQRAGYDAVLFKPSHLDDLREVVNRLLNLSAGPDPSAKEVIE